jgi:hypothetical protein
MNWAEVEKQELIDASSILELVPQRAGVPSSDFVKVKTTKKYVEMALSSVVNAVVRVNGKGLTDSKSFFVDRALLTPFIQAGRNWKGDFKLGMDDTKWYLRQGSRTAELTMRTEPLGGYGIWKEKDGLKEVKLSEELRRLLLVSQGCATADPSLPFLSCVYIGEKVVLATNGTLMFVGLRQKQDSLRFPFPIGVIPLLGNGLVKAVGVEGDQVILDCGLGYIEGSVSAVTRKDFPKKSVVERAQWARAYPVLSKLPAERLAKMLERLSSYLASVKREDLILRLEIGGEKVKAIVRVQQAKFEEQIEVEDLKGEGVLDFPFDLVKPVLEYIAEHDENVTIRVDESKKSPYAVSGASVMLLVARREK